MSVANLINLAIAVFTAAAAIAAWVSASASLKATEQANREAQESRKAAEESRKIAQQQTGALMLAARANALASRISFYSEQILEAKEAWIRANKRADPKESEAFEYKRKLELEQEHLARWLDQQTNPLGVAGTDLKLV
jgi:hypothetical protein